VARIVPVFFGVCLVLLLLLLIDGLGTAAAVYAAVLTAISAAMVFYSRYYIQEMLLVCFTFGAIVSGYRYAQSKNWLASIIDQSRGNEAGIKSATLRPSRAPSRIPAEIKATRQQKVKVSPPLGNESRNYVPGEIIIKFRKGTDKQVIEAIQTKLNLETIRIVSSPNVYLIRIKDGDSVEDVVGQLREFQEVVHSEPNYIRRAD